MADESSDKQAMLNWQRTVDADWERYNADPGHIQWLPDGAFPPPPRRGALVGALLCTGAILGVGALFLVAGASLMATGSVLRIEVVRR